MSAPSRLSVRVVPATALCAALIGIGLLLALGGSGLRDAGAAADDIVIQVYPNGSGSVTVTSPTATTDPPAAAGTPQLCEGSADQGQVCRYTYPRGTQVKLEARPDDVQSLFLGWSDLSCPAEPQPCTMMLTDDETHVAALFSPQSVMVHVSGEGVVTVKDGAVCAPAALTRDCGRFPLSGLVTLVATGDAPRWGASCDASTPATATVPATATCTVIADRFRWTEVGFGPEDPQPNHPPPIAGSLKVSIIGEGTVSNGTQNCPRLCLFKGAKSDYETLTANDGSGYRFVAWTPKRCAPSSNPKVCRARIGAGGSHVVAKFEPATTTPTPPRPGTSALCCVTPTGKGRTRRVRFRVDLGARGAVHATLRSSGGSYGRLSVERPKGAVTLRLRVKARAPRGMYRLRIRITGSAPLDRTVRVRLRS